MKKVLFVTYVSLSIALNAKSQTVEPTGIFSFSPTPSFWGTQIHGNIQNSSRNFILSSGNNAPSTGSYLHFLPVNTSDYTIDGGSINAVSVGTYDNLLSFSIGNHNPVDNSWRHSMIAKRNGKVVIGSNPFSIGTPDGYSLFVGQGILTERVKVAIKTTSDWADNVFSPTYKLLSTNKLNKFIKLNKHLPEVPSAEEVVNNGVDLAKMDALLLKKIEELTLYMLQIKKENEKLKREIVKIKKSKK